MPFEPYRGSGEGGGLGKLFALYQLQQSMKEQAEQRKRDALGLAMQIARSGGDPASVSGIDPQHAPLVQQLYQLGQKERDREGLQTYLQNAAPLAVNLNNPASRDTATNVLDSLAAQYGLSPDTAATGQSLIEQRAAAIAEEERMQRAAESRAESRSMREIGAREASDRRGVELRRDIESESRDIAAKADALASIAYGGRPEVASAIAREVDAKYRQRAPEIMRSIVSASEGLRARERITTGAEERRALVDDAVKLEQERRARIRAEQDEFVSSGASILSMDETQREKLYGQAFARYGLDANQMMTRIDMGKSAAIAKQLGTTAPLVADGADPLMAAAALKGNAYKDPLTQIYVSGSPTGEPANNASTRKGLYEVLHGFEASVEAFAESGIAGLGVTNLEQFMAASGGEQSPAFAVVQTMRENARSLLQKARSGAALNAQEIEQIETFLAKLPQITIRNGKLDRSTRARLESLKWIIESEHVGRMGFADGREARRRMKDAGRQYLVDAREFVQSLDLGAERASGGHGASHLDSLMGDDRRD